MIRLPRRPLRAVKGCCRLHHLVEVWLLWGIVRRTHAHPTGGSIREKKKARNVFLYTVFPKRPRVAHMFNHGWWRLAVGGWWRLAVGSWRLAVGGGWRRLVVGD